MTVEAHEPAERLKRLDEFTLADLESVRLVLRGDSVIDWHRLNLTADAEVDDLLRSPVGRETQRLVRAVGKALAMDMILTGRVIDAQEALAAGLAARVVADSDVREEQQRRATLRAAVV